MEWGCILTGVTLQEQKKFADKEAELTRIRTIVANAKTRINSQKQQLDALNAENQELKTKVSSTDASSGKDVKKLYPLLLTQIF